jgi:outer membrane lipase/esterase
MGMLTAGADYALTPQLLFGEAIGYGREDGDYDSGGGFDIDTTAGVVYLSYAGEAPRFVDAVAGYASKDIEKRRFVTLHAPTPALNVAGNASSDIRADEHNADVIAGCDFQTGRYTVGPRAGFRYRETKLPIYSESGDTGLELRFDEQNIDPLECVLGMFSSAAVSTSWGVLVPQAGRNYIHEFRNDQRNIQVSLVDDVASPPLTFAFNNETLDRDYFEAALGLNAVLPNAWQAYVNFSTYLGNSRMDKFIAETSPRLARISHQASSQQKLGEKCGLGPRRRPGFRDGALAGLTADGC